MQGKAVGIWMLMVYAKTECGFINELRKAEWIFGLFLSNMFQRILFMIWTIFDFVVVVVKEMKSHCTQTEGIVTCQLIQKGCQANKSTLYYRHIWEKSSRECNSVIFLKPMRYFPPKRILIICVENHLGLHLYDILY